LLFWVPYQFEGGIRKHGKDSKCQGDVPHERSSQSSESVSIPRDLREMTSRLEELTARIYLYSDSVKRLWIPMTSLKNVESINTVRSRKLRWLAIYTHGIISM
jgi:hypothetical protein